MYIIIVFIIKDIVIYLFYAFYLCLFSFANNLRCFLRAVNPFTTRGTVERDF